MANFKNITDLPVAESAEGLNLIVNDNGSAKQIAADKIGVGGSGGSGGGEPDMVISNVGGNFNGSDLSAFGEWIVGSGSFESVKAKLDAGKMPVIYWEWMYTYGGVTTTQRVQMSGALECGDDIAVSAVVAYMGVTYLLSANIMRGGSLYSPAITKLT